MSMFSTVFLKRHRRTLGTVIFLFLYSVSISFATPPTAPYQPGTTLQPSCLPGSTNCTTQILPDQSSNTGKLLSTDGSTTSWTLVANASLQNSTITINGSAIALGGSVSNLALVTNPLSQFASTTSAQLAGVLSDETGTGTLVYSTSPTLTTVGINTAPTASPLTVGGDIRIATGSGGQIVFADGSTMSSAGLGSAAALSNTTDAIVTADSDANTSGAILLKTGSTTRFSISNTGTIAIPSFTTGLIHTDVSGNLSSSLIVNGDITDGTIASTKLSSMTSANLASILSDESGTGVVAYTTSPVFTTPNIGNATGNISGNASTVTTNANLTGPITSVGNATSVASQTGTGSTFVMNTSPTLITPNIGAATGTSLNLASGAITSGLINGQTISSAANFTGTASFANNVTISGNHFLNIPISNTTARIGEYDLANQVMFSNNYTSADGQDDATKPSWAVVLNSGAGDYFKVARKAAGVVGTLPALLTVDSGGNGTFVGSVTGQAASFTTGGFSGLITSTLTSGNIFNASSGTTGILYDYYANTSGNIFSGVENSTGGGIFPGTTAYASIIGNTVNKPLQFATQNAVRMTIDGSGNTGIGTTGPLARLNIQADSVDENLGQLIISGSTSSGAKRLSVGINTTSNVGFIQAYTSGTPYYNLALNPNGGNVGIGTASPGYLLDLQKDFGNTVGVALRISNNATVSSGTASTRLLFSNHTGAARDGGAIDVKNNTAGGDNMSMNFFVRDNANTLQERMRIDASGNVGIGTTTPGQLLTLSSTGGPVFKMQNTSGLVYNWALASQYVTNNAFEIIPSTAIGGNTFTTPVATFLSSGNVGIGTTNPTVKFQVKGTATDPVLATYNGILGLETAGQTSFQMGVGNTFNGTWFQAYNQPATGGGTFPILLNPLGGNVGIGTTSPAAKLQINGNANTWSQIINANSTASQSYGLIINAGTNAGDNAFLVRDVTGSNAFLNIMGNGIANFSNTITSLKTSGDVFSAVSATTGSLIQQIASSGGGNLIIGINNSAGNNVITTNPYASYIFTHTSTDLVFGTNDTVRMTIANTGAATFSGNVNIGGDGINAGGVGATTSGLLNIGQTYTSGTITLAQFNKIGVATIGSITYNGTNTLYNATSDRRLKENIVPTAKGLEALMQIQVRDFNFISDPNHTLTQGFIAQDLYPIYPDAVTVGGDDPNVNPWQVDYGRLTPLIIQSIQDMNIKVQSIPTLTDQSLYTKIAEFLQGIAEQGTAIVNKVKTQNIETDNLCVGTVCVTQDQFLNMVQSANPSIQTPPPASSPTPDPVPNATCSDGIQNQDETGIDSGGVCTSVNTTPIVLPE